jgi:hypothetical protein
MAVIQKWCADTHGFYTNEEKYSKFLSTKYLLCWDTHYYDSDSEDVEYDEYDTIEQIDHALDFICIRTDVESWRNKFPCIIKSTYMYRERNFCVRNYGIELFQKLWRDFHYKKMQHYKAVKNLQYRQMYGRYPKF